MGSITVLASHYEGKELNSPNDIVVKRDGAIYFSDPTYGRIEFYGVPRPTELDFRGVYRLDPDTKALNLLADDFKQPNGLCFSRDEKHLFVNDTERGHIRIFDVRPDGTLDRGRVWAETTGEGPGAPDGMKIDSDGQRLLLWTGRHPRLRSVRHMSRRDQGAGAGREFRLGRCGQPQPLHHGVDISVSCPGWRAGPLRVARRSPP